MTVIAMKMEYKSHADRRIERERKATRAASDRLAKDITLAAELAFGIRKCRSCTEHLPLDKVHFAPQKGSLNDFAPRCRACIAGFDSWTARVQFHSDKATAKQELAEREQTDGIRECASCKERLTMNADHFSAHATSRNGFMVRCRACHLGYSSWSAKPAEKAQKRAQRQALRDTERAARAQAKAQVRALKDAQRAKVSAVKHSDEWKSARKTKHKALEMMPLYSELAYTAWQAWDHDWSAEQLGEALQEVASSHNRQSFLELNSQGYLAATEGRTADADPYEMARTWEALEARWQDKLNNVATQAQQDMLNELENVSSRST